VRACRVCVIFILNSRGTCHRECGLHLPRLKGEERRITKSREEPPDEFPFFSRPPGVCAHLSPFPFLSLFYLLHIKVTWNNNKKMLEQYGIYILVHQSKGGWKAQTFDVMAGSDYRFSGRFQQGYRDPFLFFFFLPQEPLLFSPPLFSSCCCCFSQSIS